MKTQMRLKLSKVTVLSLAALIATGAEIGALTSGKRAAQAADAMLQGTSFFKKKDYKNAAIAYKKAMVEHPKDATIAYYYAVCLQYLNDTKGAKLAYLDVMTRFPQSSSAAYASSALTAMDPSLLQGAQTQHLQSFSGASRSAGGSFSNAASGGSYGGSTNGDVIPSSSSVNYANENGHMIVDVTFNGRRTKAIFDTGADIILMGRNNLAEMGLPMPPVERRNKSRGVGNTVSEVEGATMTVTCGGVTRHVLVWVQDRFDSMPLLGASFSEGMHVAASNGSIRFTAENAGARRSNTRGVPFRTSGGSAIVTAQINGRPIDMVFDTGASGTLFTQSQAASVGITVPDGADIMVGSGVGGGVVGHYVNGIDIKLGPVEKRNMKVAVAPDAGHQNALLGVDFFGDMHYEIDRKAHMIYFD